MADIEQLRAQRDAELALAKAAETTPDETLGKGGERLHEWAMGGDPAGGELMAAPRVASRGVPRRAADVRRFCALVGADGPTGPARVPLVVVTHQAPDEGGVYTSVTDGIESALRRGRSRAARPSP